MDNQVTEMPTSTDQKSSAMTTGYGAIANGDSQPPGIDGNEFCC